MPLLVVFLLGASDFARVYSANIAISSAAREGASFGSRSNVNAADGSAIRDAALAENATIWGVAPVVTSNIGEDEYGFDYVEVTVDYEFSTIFSFPPIPDSIDLSHTVRMRVIGN
jgi:Flp pilus assembly protein TadG